MNVSIYKTYPSGLLTCKEEAVLLEHGETIDSSRNINR